MLRRHPLRRHRPAPAPEPAWSAPRLLGLLAGAAVVTAALLVGLALAVGYAVHPAASQADRSAGASGRSAAQVRAVAQAPLGTAGVDPRDALAARRMPPVPTDAAQPAAVSLTDPGAPLTLPRARGAGPAGVPTGFPATPQGALAQLAAIDQAALDSASLAHSRALVAGWALPGGPTASSWSGVRAVADLVDAASRAQATGPVQLSVAATPLMGMLKGTVGSSFVVPCVDLEVDVTLVQTSRAAVADCQRMTWTAGRWMIGPGPEPATPPSVWPDTALASRVGYRDLRRE